MTARPTTPHGVPCWADLSTPDVEGSRRFYREVFGWEATEPQPEFGGYFTFLREGVPVAGGMGDLEGASTGNAWNVYLASDDIAATATAVEAAGGKLLSPVMAVGDLGSMITFGDPAGAYLGAWQRDTFPGFTVVEEPNAPSWFELHTRDHAGALAFYRQVFGWQTQSVGDTDEFRYAVVADPAGKGEVAGVMDASGFLPAGQAPHWSVYWQVADLESAAAAVTNAGGTVIDPPEATPYGRLATAADPSGARFKLRQTT